MTTSNIVWAMRRRALHNAEKHIHSMDKCDALCKSADHLIQEDERIKRQGGIR